MFGVPMNRDRPIEAAGLSPETLKLWLASQRHLRLADELAAKCSPAPRGSL